MRTETLQLASELAGRTEAFALATVVRREPPSSARVGDSAIVTPDGRFHGWLGGSCTRPTVIREALAALADGAPRLIGIVRDPAAASGARPGLSVFPMACHSGGSVEIYIEPLLPARRLLIFGVSPTAQALARLANVLGYRVEAVDPEASEALFPDASRLVTSDESVEPPGSGQDAARCFAVVATLGQRDEEAAWAASRMLPAYVGVVASRKRFGQIRETLAARGATAEQLDRIANPAGLDIGAQTPEEIALSILAEITRGPAPPLRSPGKGAPAPTASSERAPAQRSPGKGQGAAQPKIRLPPRPSRSPSWIRLPPQPSRPPRATSARPPPTRSPAPRRSRLPPRRPRATRCAACPSQQRRTVIRPTSRGRPTASAARTAASSSWRSRTSTSRRRRREA